MGALLRLLLLTIAATLLLIAPARADIPFAPCPDSGFEAFGCATVTVPLDRSGAVPGTVPLFVRRLQPEGAAGPTQHAVVGLAGGPGQAAAPLARSFAISLASALGDRDLLVFDQRGTGRSDPLVCPSLGRSGTEAAVIARCATELGPRRAFHRSVDSVDDLEALRVAGGYAKLTIYGVSYGTKVALDYAARYPQNVERLVLDSVVPPEGPDPLLRASLTASRRMLAELCGNGACRRATPDVTADVSRLAARTTAARGSYVDGRGRRQRATLRGSTLYSLFQAGDLNPVVRAQLPAAMRSALQRDPTPLLRLAVSVFGAPGGSQVPEQSSNNAVFLATACEETLLPWDRAASLRDRVAQAGRALAAQPASAFAPFTRATVATVGLLRLCQGWPNATPAPAAPGALPDVPVLLLNGTADLRTPLEDAQRVAAAFPQGQLVGVPFVGHSVLGSDPSGCAGAAVAGFFNGTGVAPCGAGRPFVAPIARAPRSVNGLGTTGTVRGKPGRTLTAVLRTADDALLQVLNARVGNGATRIGGMRRGIILRRGESILLRGVEFVPGVRVSGVLAEDRSMRVTVAGRAAARGTVAIDTSRVLTGRLGGKRFRLTPRPGAARAGARRGWLLDLEPRDVLPRPALVRAAAG